MSDKFDLDALEVEGEDAEPFEFTFQGESYAMTPAASMPWQDQLALEMADTSESLRLILGPDQYARFEKQPMTAARLGKLLEKWLEHQGLKPGE